MKREVWGYSAEEVDAILMRLADQNKILMQRNDFLEDELKEMNLRLMEARAMMNEGMSKADAEGYEELKRAYTAQQERLDSILTGLRSILENN